MNRMTKKYLGVTFLVSWLLWGVTAAAGRLGISFLDFNGPLGRLFYVLGGVSPAICEILIKKTDSSKEEFKEFLKKIVNPKHSIWMYVYAIGGALVIQAIPAFLGLVEVKQPLYIGFVMIFPMIIGGGVEEIGWRGLLQPELEKRYPHILATVMVGVIWAVWHLPLWWIEGTNQHDMSFLWFCCNAIMLSFFIGSVTYVSGSIFLAILAHASINAFWEVIGATEEIIPSLLLMFFIFAVTAGIDYFAKGAKEEQGFRRNSGRAAVKRQRSL